MRHHSIRIRLFSRDHYTEFREVSHFYLVEIHQPLRIKKDRPNQVAPGVGQSGIKLFRYFNRFN